MSDLADSGEVPRDPAGNCEVCVNSAAGRRAPIELRYYRYITPGLIRGARRKGYVLTDSRAIESTHLPLSRLDRRSAPRWRRRVHFWGARFHRLSDGCDRTLDQLGKALVPEVPRRPAKLKPDPVPRKGRVVSGVNGKPVMRDAHRGFAHGLHSANLLG